MRQELIDFLKWFFNRNRYGENYDFNEIVDEYLSINDHAPIESRAINENEDEKEFCVHQLVCPHYEGSGRCGKCDPDTKK